MSQVFVSKGVHDTVELRQFWGEFIHCHLYNNTLSRRTTTMRSNDTLINTSFQLISGFFHVNQGVLCSEHAEQASSRGVLEGGGGGGEGNRLAK